MHPRTLMIGSDVSLFDRNGEAFLRMKSYAALHDRLVIMTVSGKGEAIADGNLQIFGTRFLFKPLALVEMFTRCVFLFRKERIECIMAQDPFMFGLVALIIARAFSVSCVVGVYGTDPTNAHYKRESLQHRCYAAISRFVFANVTAIQTDGPETVEPLREKYGNKVFFKPMLPSNLEELKTLPRTFSEDSFKILFMARFVPQKNIPLLVEVIVAVHGLAGDRVRFTIVGAGPEHTRFVEEMRERALSNIIDIRGVVSRDEMKDLIMSHHALLLTSRYEGFPRVFMEAAATGLPVITSRVGGIKDIIVDGVSGIVLSQDTSAAEWARRIIALAEDRERLEVYSKNIRDLFMRVYGDKTLLDYQRPLVEFVASQR